MALDATETPKANGLKTAIDIVISPKDAFESIRVAPTWGWAFLISSALAVAAFFLTLPATLHGFAGDFAANPQMAQMTPDQVQAALKMTATWMPLGAIIIPIAILFFALIEAVVMLVFNAVGRGTGAFKSLWAASVNIGIVYGLGQIVTAVVVLLRGADSFATAGEVQRAIPSLALVAPSGNVKMAAFLATINPFTIWSVVLVALTMTVVARVSKVPAWLAAIVCYALPTLIAVGFAK
jgi:hypothetical protein